MAYTIQGGRLQTAFKVLIYGPEGIGKSTFAAQFPQPVFIDTEHSTDAMDVARFPHPESWAMLLGEVQQVRDDAGCCRTLVVDTADWAEKLCVRDLLAKYKKNGIEDFGYGKGYVYLGEEFGRLLNLLEEVKGRGVNVVLTAHAAMRKVEQPDEMGAYDRWELKMSKYISPMIKEWADMVLFANYKTVVVRTDSGKGKAQGGKRVMYTSHHPCWDAKNRYGLPDELPFEYAQVAQLFVGSAPAAEPKPVAASARSVESLPDTPPQAAPKQQPDIPPQTVPIQQSAKPVEDAGALDGIDPRLTQLMRADGVSPEELQGVVAGKGYFPADMAVRDYPADFVAGWCVPFWEKIVELVKSNRLDLPF